MTTVAERTDAANALARMLLMVDEQGNDLTLRYLKILIETGLPRAAHPKQILIIGAGIAGLVAGRLLKGAGHRVTILEANANRVGGRIKTWRGRDGWFEDSRQYAEAGAMRLPDFHPLTLSLVDTLRLRRQRFYNVDVKERRRDGGTRVIYNSPHDGTPLWVCPHAPVCAPGDAPVAAARTYIRTNGLQVRRGAYAADPKPVNAGFQIDRKQHLTAARMLDEALEIVRDYYSERGADGVRRNFAGREAWIEGWAKLIFDFDPYSMLRFLREQARLPEGAIHAIGTLENLTSRLPLSFLHSFIGRSIINPGVTYWEIAGGMQELTDALARDLDGEIVRNARMIELRHGDGVEVRTIPEPDAAAVDVKAKKTIWRGDFAVVTIPFSSLRFVDVDPLFSYKKRRAIIELHYDAATKVVLEFRKRWWEWDEKRWQAELGPDEWREQREWMQTHAGDAAHQFIGGGSVTDNPNRFIYYPSHPAGDSEGGVILASYTWADDARRWDSIPDQNRYLYALKGLQQLHGPMIEKFWTGRGKTQAWARDFYAFGEASVFLPGQLSDLHPSVPLPEGRVHFAGEHTSLKHAWIEGAVESAVRAAIEVHER